jgi:hypothetical protein
MHAANRFIVLQQILPCIIVPSGMPESDEMVLALGRNMKFMLTYSTSHPTRSLEVNGWNQIMLLGPSWASGDKVAFMLYHGDHRTVLFIQPISSVDLPIINILVCYP